MIPYYYYTNMTEGVILATKTEASRHCLGGRARYLELSIVTIFLTSTMPVARSATFPASSI
jgi:hypothetical protein